MPGPAPIPPPPGLEPRRSSARPSSTPDDGARLERERRAGQGLDWFSFFVANLQTGFGPFVSVYLTAAKWTQIDIGLVLTAGSLIGLFGQVPGGALVDAARSKRALVALSVIGVGFSALLVAASPLFAVIMGAWVLHAVASCTITPAVNSISLGLVGHRGLGRRLGRNASFASVGSAVAAAGMGACGHYVSNQAVFFVTAALAVPAVVALFRIPPGIAPRSARVEPAAAGPAPVLRRPARERIGAVTRDFLAVFENRLIFVLLGLATLFFLANGAALPLLASTLTKRSADAAPLLIAACIVIPQVCVAVLSPAIGTRANSWGRRPLLLVAFGALTAKTLLLGFNTDPFWLVVVQVLDGVSAATLGVALPTVAADLTRRSGHYALAQGLLGTAMGIGAAISTTLGGFLADRFGTAWSFYGLAGCGGLGLLAAALLLPETRDAAERDEAASR